MKSKPVPEGARSAATLPEPNLRTVMAVLVTAIHGFTSTRMGRAKGAAGAHPRQW